MLKRISVKNYKGFKDEIVLDFSDYKNYNFNTFAIKNNLIKSAMIYGKNGAGKSNLGLAIFDLVMHLTDKQKNPIQASSYINGDSDEDTAYFKYEFLVEDKAIRYEYSKFDADTLTYESLYIDDQKVFSYNFLKEAGDFEGLKLIDATNLKTDIQINISLLRYIAFNANLASDNLISKLMDFINRMLWFRSVTEGNQYIGFNNEKSLLMATLIQKNLVQSFETYLNNKGLNYKLEAYKSPVGREILLARYKHKVYEFLETASNGTKVLLLYFYWIQQLKDASFVFIDEFDAFYHTFLAQEIFSELAQNIDGQLIITTHNTDLLSNNILRPDCYFIVTDGKIKSLPNCTERELREGHNLEKMFKAGEFNV